MAVRPVLAPRFGGDGAASQTEVLSFTGQFAPAPVPYGSPPTSPGAARPSGPPPAPKQRRRPVDWVAPALLLLSLIFCIIGQSLDDWFHLYHGPFAYVGGVWRMCSTTNVTGKFCTAYLFADPPFLGTWMQPVQGAVVTACLFLCFALLSLVLPDLALFGLPTIVAVASLFFAVIDGPAQFPSHRITLDSDLQTPHVGAGWALTLLSLLTAVAALLVPIALSRIAPAKPPVQHENSLPEEPHVQQTGQSFAYSHSPASDHRYGPHGFDDLNEIELDLTPQHSHTPYFWDRDEGEAPYLTNADPTHENPMPNVRPFVTVV
eukprot:TRINITY_DN95704_c0_g1_i1.p1 TRINITY_DN95704_c0_g1~~TRINITY_DN95704_c0_g1_i1.p1  ORF type:complete len:319 (+),score=29.10 TRINITY_DN95704_c0_g1_i1:54-1010(+)